MVPNKRGRKEKIGEPLAGRVHSRLTNDLMTDFEKIRTWLNEQKRLTYPLRGLHYALKATRNIRLAKRFIAEEETAEAKQRSMSYNKSDFGRLLIEIGLDVLKFHSKIFKEGCPCPTCGRHFAVSDSEATKTKWK